jgi:Vitamin K epoxide reductase family
MSRTLRRVMTVLAVIGLGVAAYLTYIHYAGINPACTAGQSCIKVQTSVWSKVGGVPVEANRQLTDCRRSCELGQLGAPVAAQDRLDDTDELLGMAGLGDPGVDTEPEAADPLRHR